MGYIYGNKRTIVPYLFTGNSAVISLARAVIFRDK